jgi:hypothetical protein
MLTLILSRTHACTGEIVEKIGEKLAYMQITVWIEH